MRKFEQKIKEMGYELKDLSPKLAQDVKDYVATEREWEQHKAEIASLDPDSEEYEAKIDQIQQYEDVLEEEDNDLVVKVAKYLEKKPYYEQHAQMMKAKKEEKRSGQAQPAAPKAAAPAPVAAAPVAAAPQVVASQGVVVEPVVEKKKGGSNWVLWGGLAVLGLLVGVNVMRNRE